MCLLPLFSPFIYLTFPLIYLHTVSICSAPACHAPHVLSFHTSSRREEEASETAPAAPASKGGLFGTGLSEWFALPIGITAAVPIIKFDWYVVNEETQLAAVFIAFCVALYSQGGDAIYKSLDESAVTILKEHHEAEDKVIAALEQKLEFLQANKGQVEHFEAINALREEAYRNLNAAGAVKPQHDFKVQVEKMLNMIAAEEASNTEKAKISLMEAATADVTSQFSSEKALKKARKAYDKADADATRLKEDVDGSQEELERIASEKDDVVQAKKDAQQACDSAANALSVKKAELETLSQDADAIKAVEVDIQNQVDDYARALKDNEHKAKHWAAKLAELREKLREQDERLQLLQTPSSQPHVSPGRRDTVLRQANSSLRQSPGKRPASAGADENESPQKKANSPCRSDGDQSQAAHEHAPVATEARQG